MSSNQVSLLFVTDLKPNEVSARKYNPTTQTYANVPGATITETTYNAQHALLLTYTITDNGPLDTDPAVGSITDPVGLAIPVATSVASLTNTGANTLVISILAIFITALSIATRLRTAKLPQ